MYGQVLDAIIKGGLIGLFMAISVGPTLFAVIKYSLNHSYKAGMAFVLGVSISDIMYVTIANVAATWLAVLDSFRVYMAYGGATILIVVGLFGLLHKSKQKTTTDKEIVTITGGHYFRIWLSGFLINTINPGVIISWMTAVTATANSAGTYRFILFGTCLGFILSIDLLKVFLADKIRTKLTEKRISLLHNISSIILLVLGVLLLLTTLFNMKFIPS